MAGLITQLASQRLAAAPGGASLRRTTRPPPTTAVQGPRRRCAAQEPGDPGPAAASQGSLNLQSRRRDVLLGGLLLAAAAPLGSRAAEEPSSSGSGDASRSSAGEELTTFSNPSQGYNLLRPAGWEQVGKAGADSLFRDPAKKSTNVGVTVYPVTIASLEQFGDLTAVGQRLLGAERDKESTMGVEMVSQSSRKAAGGSGATLYDFEYELDTTRGRKRVLSTVTIAGKKLYIANGNISCGKEPSCTAVEAQLPLVRAVTQSLTVM